MLEEEEESGERWTGMTSTSANRVPSKTGWVISLTKSSIGTHRQGWLLLLLMMYYNWFIESGYRLVLLLLMLMMSYDISFGIELARIVNGVFQYLLSLPRQEPVFRFCLLWRSDFVFGQAIGIPLISDTRGILKRTNVGEHGLLCLLDTPGRDHYNIFILVFVFNFNSFILIQHAKQKQQTTSSPMYRRNQDSILPTQFFVL